MAVTRARRHIAIVCDTQTVQNHAFLKSLIDHVTQHGEVRTAFEYIPDIVPQNYTHNHKEGKTKPPATKQKEKEPPPSKAKQGKKTETGSLSNGNAANERRQKSAETKLTKEEEDKKRYCEIKEEVEVFLKDLDRAELQFPSSYNAHDRLLVHQVAEELGLTHESTGEGKDRRITVARPAGPAGPAPAEQRIPEEEEEVHPSPSESTQEPPSLDLKGLHLERMKREQQKREESARQRQQQNNTPAASSSKRNKSAKGFVELSFLYLPPPPGGSRGALA